MLCDLEQKLENKKTPYFGVFYLLFIHFII